MAKKSDNVTPLRGPVLCPECRKPSAREHYPFCSAGCRNLDLNRWFSDRYVIAGDPVDDEAERPPTGGNSEG